MKVAYLVTPHIGGTYTIFEKLRTGLARYGVDFRCVSPRFSGISDSVEHDEPRGIEVVAVPRSLRDATARIIKYLQSGGYRLFVAMPGSGHMVSNLARYVPPSIRCVARVCTMTRGAYAPTRAIMPYVDKIIAVSDRIRYDLVSRYKPPSDLIRTIYNGVAVGPEQPPGNQTPGEVCRLLYLGRLEDSDKGVMLLPAILRAALRRVGNIQLDIAGLGPDEARLRAALAQMGLEAHARLLGAISPPDLPDCFTAHDCFVLPSRFEGCPSALLEAMAAGCVPIASMIRGSTTTIIEHELSGILCPIANTEAFGRAISRLARDPGPREQLGRNAQRRIQTHFSLDQMAREYADLFREVLAGPTRHTPPLPLADYHVPRALRPTWRTRVPQPLKNCARKWAERLGVSI